MGSQCQCVTSLLPLFPPLHPSVSPPLGVLLHAHYLVFKDPLLNFTLFFLPHQPSLL